MADLFITKINYDKNNVLVKVKVRWLKGNKVLKEEEYTKIEIISLIKKGYSVNTAYKKSPNKWSKGDDVNVISGDNGEYLRTDGNKKLEDNLGSLDRY